MRSLLPLGLFLLACAAIYVGTIQAAFTVLMRLPLRIAAERNGTSEALARYLREPVQLFVPTRLLLGFVLVAIFETLALLLGVGTWRAIGLLFLLTLAIAVVCEHLLPQLIVRRNPQAVLEFLLPSFRLLATPLLPLTYALVGVSSARRDKDRDRERERDRDRERDPLQLLDAEGASPETEPDTDERRASDEEIDAHHEERQLLQSIVDFGDLLAREVMTPRPDIVAIRATLTVKDLRELFREQQYSRMPVYHENLDNIVGIVFVKDLLLLEDAHLDERLVSTLSRPAIFVPETKRVPELLKEFQRKQVQAAIVVDEYGGTAGLVTIEDLLEEIVGEIRDEYDVETEPIVEEGNGTFVFSGKADIDEVADRLDTDIEREGFETVGGWVLSHLGRVPAVGETFTIGDMQVEVLEAERRRVHKVRMRKARAEQGAGAGGEKGRR